MAAMGRGGAKTPDQVVRLINDEVAKLGQNATARAIGLPLRSVQKYMQGISEPTQASLDKLSDYFQVPVSWLRGDIKSSYETIKYVHTLPENTDLVNKALGFVEGMGNETALKLYNNAADLTLLAVEILKKLEGLRSSEIGIVLKFIDRLYNEKKTEEESHQE